MPDHRTPSLLEPDSRGGETAEHGFAFQESVLLAKLPYWLSFDGFASLIRESIGDTEIAMFTPSKGMLREMLEVKDFRVTPAHFWPEIHRFLSVDAGSPNTFQWFRLVVQDVSQDLKPLVKGLRRVRSPYGFYDPLSDLVLNSINEYREIVLGLGETSEVADFLFRRVQIDIAGPIPEAQSFGYFFGNLTQALPQYGNLTGDVLRAIYEELRRSVRPINTPISRREIEKAISRAIHAANRPTPFVRLHTASGVEEKRTELVMDWRDFSGSGKRQYPEPEEWNEKVVGELIATKEFILRHHASRLIRITGTRRLSANLALGHVFSATGGFVLEMDYRGQIWRSSDHADDTQELHLRMSPPRLRGNRLVVSVGIIRDIGGAVHQYICSQGMSAESMLNLFYEHAITSAAQANAVIAHIKSAIRDALEFTGASEVHLFCATPAFIALLLGHRLNATATIHCYEHVPPNEYVPTCTLYT